MRTSGFAYGEAAGGIGHLGHGIASGRGDIGPVNRLGVVLGFGGMFLGSAVVLAHPT